MAYIDGFLIAVPKDNQQAFIEHADKADAVFIELGANRVVETWSDDVSPGKTTDFFQAVKAKDNEAIVFSWIEWPDKKTRDDAVGKMQSMMHHDPRINPKQNPMPFDGARLIYGGFEPILDLKA